ncbi:MAG: secretion system protein [Halobacteriales archaeon]|nr:secretion system protein [Halobacteriales archaeon]
MDIPAPVAPDDPAAWYAPDVRAQDAVSPGVVATVRERTTGDAPFAYDVREPSLPPGARATLADLSAPLADARGDPPRTTTGVRERFKAPLPESWREICDRSFDGSPATRRRLDYHLRATHCGLGDLTALALDSRIEAVDAGETVAVHTERFAPAITEFEATVERVARLASERLSRETVAFCGHEIPVVRYRDRTLGTDSFTIKYAADEPPLHSGDRDRIDRCRRHLLATADAFDTTDPDAVRDRARTFLDRDLAAGSPETWLTTVRDRTRELLADHGLAAPPVEASTASDRLDSLCYYVLREFVGEGPLTIPLRDERLEAVAATPDGRVTVTPHDGASPARRLPTNITLDANGLREQVGRLAAAGGTDLSATTPTATVTVRPSGTETILDCTLGLARTTDAGPQLSVRRRPADPPTAPELVAGDRLPTAVVALCWLLAETRGRIAVIGERGAGKTTLLNALIPFVPYDCRPVVAGDTTGVAVPHESSLRLTTHAHTDPDRCVSTADVGVELSGINPAITVLDDVDGPDRGELLVERLAAGGGVLATVDARTPEIFRRRLASWPDGSDVDCTLDVVLVTRHIDGKRRVTAVGSLTDGESGTDAPAWTEHWSRGDNGSRGNSGSRGDNGSRDDDELALDGPLAERLARRTAQSVAALDADFERKRRYVSYLVEEGIDGHAELFSFLADLRTDEAATVERVGHRGDAYHEK